MIQIIINIIHFMKLSKVSQQSLVLEVKVLLEVVLALEMILFQYQVELVYPLMHQQSSLISFSQYLFQKKKRKK